MTRSKLLRHGLQVLTLLTGTLASVALVLILAWLANGAPISYSGINEAGESVSICGGSLFRQSGWPLTLLDLLTVPSAILSASVWLFKFISFKKNSK